MSRYALLLTAVVVSAMLPTSNAQAQQWQVCNKTPYPITIAVGYVADSRRLKSEGWWRIGPCTGCEVVLLPEETADRSTGYLYARSPNGELLLTGDETLCVSKNWNFKILDHRNCGGRNFPSRQFKRFNIDMRRDFTTNIRLEGRSCNL